jgi:hypothetical protein
VRGRWEIDIGYRNTNHPQIKEIAPLSKAAALKKHFEEILGESQSAHEIPPIISPKGSSA